MKNKLYVVLFLLGLSGVKSFAQQNFFNVPSSDITEKKKIFFQQQFNLFANSIASNTTLCYGLGNEFEIGLNVLGVTYGFDKRKFICNSKNEQPIYPSIGLNLQKQLFELNNYSLAMGGQLLHTFKPGEWEYYLFINNKYELKKTKLIAGFYAGNNNYFGTEPRFSNGMKTFGVQVGIEYEIIHEKLFLQADFISGRTPMSNLILGGAYKLSNHWIISSGFQIPNSKKTSSSGLIVELTFV
ncbi:MAG: hypothetical protein K1X82_13590 [Bacteroidia bacterium]|nr:hypothetical protein [Bacteroidia bacterium]